MVRRRVLVPMFVTLLAGTLANGTLATAASARPAAIRTPVVRSVSPASSRTAGGRSVVIRGKNLAHAVSVRFGSARGRHLVVRSNSTLTVVVPRHTAGSVDVRVVMRVHGKSRRSARSHHARLAYVAPPKVTNVAPAVVGSRGGQLVTVRGSGFTRGSTVRFGTSTLRTTRVSGSLLTVIAPEHGARRLDVRVTSPYGTSATTAVDRITYRPPSTPPVTPPPLPPTTPPTNTSPAVSGLTADSAVGRVTLHWHNPAGVTGLLVRRSVGGTPPAAATDGTGVAVTGVPTSAVDDAVADFVTYSYSVFAKTGGDYSAPASTARSAPGPVTGTAATTAPGRMTFRWSNPVGTEHVVVGLAKGGGVQIPPPGAAPQGTDIGPAESYLATGLTARSQYTLSIFTFDAADNVAGATSISEVTPDADDTAPDPVTAVAAAPKPTSVVLTWTNPAAGDVVGVTVARGDGDSTPASPSSPYVVGTSAQGGVTLTDSHAEPGHAYTYALWAIDYTGNYSEPVAVRVTTPAGAPPAPVSDLAATPLPPGVVAEGQSIELRWAAPPGTASFLIARAVGATAPSAPGPSGGWTVPAPAGSFLDSGLPPATRYTYAVWAVGADGTRSGVATVTATTDPNLPRHLTGHVINSVTRQPVAAVPLDLVDGQREFTVTSGADGSYRLDVPVGTYDVCATAGHASGGGAAHGYLDTCRRTVVSAAPATTYDPPLTPAVAVTGTVTDATTHQPVAGAEMVVPYSSPPLHVTSGSDGAYVLTGLGASPDQGALNVNVGEVTNGAPYGYAPQRFTFPATAPGQTVTHDVALQRLPVVTVHGKLTSARDDAPVAGAGIVLLPDGYRAQVGQVAARTSTDGSFTASIGALPGQSVYVCFDAERPAGFTGSCFGGADFDPDAAYPVLGTGTAVTSGQDVSTTLQPMSVITGTVRSSDGDPLSGVPVRAAVTNRQPVLATTDAAGRYRLRTVIRPGHFSGEFVYLCTEASRATGGSSAGGYLSACPGPIRPTADQPTSTLDFVAPAAAAVTGIVTDARSGSPLAGVSVLFESDAYGPERETTTAADGSWTVVGIDPARRPFRVCFDPSGLDGPEKDEYAHQCVGGAEPTSFNPQAGVRTRVDAPLVRAGTLRGVLRGADTAAPLPGVKLTLLGSPTPTDDTVTTDSAGRFTFPRLEPGATYQLSSPAVAHAPLGYLAARFSHAPAVDDPGAGWVIRVAPGDDLDADFALTPAAALAVTVVNGAGQPVAGATLSTSTMSGPPLDVPPDTRTSAGGTATLVGLQSRDYNALHYVCAGGGSGPGTSVGYAGGCAHLPALVAGHAEAVTIVLGPAFGPLATTVYDATTHQPVPGASVTYFFVDDAGAVTNQTFGVADGAGVAYPVLGGSMGSPQGAPPPSADHARLCVSADGYRTTCGAEGADDGTAGPVYSTQQDVQTAVQIALVPD